MPFDSWCGGTSSNFMFRGFLQEICIIITADEFSYITAVSHLNPLFCHHVIRNASISACRMFG